MDWAEPSENGVRRRALVSSLKAAIYLASRTAVLFDTLWSPSLIAFVTDKSGYSVYGFGWSRLIPILDWSFLSPKNFRNKNSPPTHVFHSISLNRYSLLEIVLHQFLPRVWDNFRPYSRFVQNRLKGFLSPLRPSSRFTYQ
jgi:hypothetical protein